MESNDRHFSANPFNRLSLWRELIIRRFNVAQQKEIFSVWCNNVPAYAIPKKSLRSVEMKDCAIVCTDKNWGADS